ncbi:nuclear transport factor 2 family protein [Nocardia sp. NPDC051570]|uniref:nuclear transport factor 2 family protein n=1 Tax=Nocardia sp. NPDC051570 TaxID=3364324 RepID=UPI0037B6D3BD
MQHQPVADRATIEQLVYRLTARDIEGLLELFTGDAQVEIPFQPPGFPSTMVGHGQIREALTVLDVYESDPFTMCLADARPLSECGEWLVQVDGRMVVRATGRPYHNRYLANCRIAAGKIAALTVYHDPLTQLAAYDLARTEGLDDCAWERAAIERFYDLLFVQDHDSLLDMVAEDIEFRLPWPLPGLPERVVGREPMRARALVPLSRLWTPGCLARIGIRPFTGAHTWVADVLGDLTAQHSGRSYQAHLRAEIRFRHGKIAQLIQYSNPLDQIIALGADIPGVNAPGLGIDLPL